MNTQTNIAQDHEAILQVVAAETATFAASDFDGWAACWVQDERTREVCISTSFGITITEGWDALAKYMREVFAAGAVCDLVDFQRENVSITINGDIAYMVFEGRSTQASGRVESTYETRILEREKGTWRILYSAFVLWGHQRTDENRLAVDAKGNIICAPEKARAALNAHPGLQISNGKLRGAKPAWDKVLQAGLTCAAEQHSYFQHYRYQTQSGHTFRLPLVLGETDNGEVAVCTLFVRDGMTFVEVQSDSEVEERLMVAKAIFGLSDGQLGLARQIIQGANLKTAAQTLGISINTARTHLSRIYDKTGVKAQTALVRTLLSVG